VAEFVELRFSLEVLANKGLFHPDLGSDLLDAHARLGSNRIPYSFLYLV
jgi:hypothetical protein